VTDSKPSVFTDTDKARNALERLRWPDGIICPHCGCRERIGSSRGKSHRPGRYYCGDCSSQFTVTVNTLFENSKVPLDKWWLATHLLGAGEHGTSINQLHRRLGVTYKTAWFMAQRLRGGLQGRKLSAVSTPATDTPDRRVADGHVTHADPAQAGPDQARTVRLMSALVAQRGSAASARGLAEKTRQKLAQKQRASEKSTRTAILEVACRQLARDGHEGLSLTAVAQRAGVNRGTAYLHFKTRAKLVKATTDWVSDMLYEAVYGDGVQPHEPDAAKFDVPDYNDRLASFALKNPELCRVWLLQVIASPDPGKDRFWREFQGSTARWARSEYAQPHIDPEVLTVLALAGNFLWPVWVQARYGRRRGGQVLARRFTNQFLRLAMFGSVRAECYPDIRKRLQQAGLVESLS
jgi:AcrR family transcriptional regulator/transposase-like protein